MSETFSAGSGRCAASGGRDGPLKSVGEVDLGEPDSTEVDGQVEAVVVVALLLLPLLLALLNPESFRRWTTSSSSSSSLRLSSNSHALPRLRWRCSSASFPAPLLFLTLRRKLPVRLMLPLLDTLGVPAAPVPGVEPWVVPLPLLYLMEGVTGEVAEVSDSYGSTPVIR